MKKQSLTAKDVSEIIGISDAKAYGLIREMNAELKEQGYLTVAGKVPIAFFKKKCYGYEIPEVMQ